MPLEPAETALGKKVEKILAWGIFVFVATVVSAMGGFWWLLEGNTIVEGAIGMSVITAFTFNHLPTQGRMWFTHKEVKWLYLPVWMINVCAFLAGLWRVA